MISVTYFVPNFDLDSITLCRATWGGRGRLADRSSFPGWPSRSSRSSSWAGLRTALVYSLYDLVAAAISRIITELRVFVVQGWRGDMGAGLEWSEPIGIMMAWRRSLGHHHGDRRGDAQLRWAGADARLGRR